MNFLGGKKILQKGDVPVSADTALKKKTLILFYFTILESEHCRNFDTKLRDVFTEATLRKVEMAIIVVSTENEKELAATNVKTNYMDWYSVMNTDDLRHTLIYNYGVTHVPMLIVVKKDGTVVTKNGVKDIETLGINVLVSWT